MKRHLILTALLALVLPAAVAAAPSAAALLDRELDAIRSLRGEFEQVVINNTAQVTDRASGELLLSRPGKFRLEYKKPYEQLYIADGNKVWAYDKDLAQVTVRPLSDALGSTPALLLSGGAPIDRDFEVNALGEKSGLDWFELRPRAKESQFDRIRLALAEGAIRVMEMVDNFGQTTRLSFSEVQRNPSLPASAFEFTPPPGVDVVGEGR